jgi:hypothetical protein
MPLAVTGKNLQPLPIIAMAPFELVVRDPADVFSWVNLAALVYVYVMAAIARRGMPKSLSSLARALPIWGSLSRLLSCSCLFRLGRTP